MAGSRGYSSYHGRKPLWKILLAILLTLVILAAVGFLLLQKYLVYDASGVPHLELPGQSQGDVSAAGSGAASSEDLNLVIEDSDTAPKQLQAVQLPQTPLADWDWPGVITPYRESGENNALVVTVKAAGGRIYVDSDSNALTGQNVPADTTQALSALTGDSDGKYTIARLSCLRDALAAKADIEGMGLKNTGGYIFYDGNNENWLDPGKEATQAYLGTLATACADLGFDEILLTDLTFPTVGKVNKIAYPAVGAQAALRSLVTAIRSALDAAGYQTVQLSVELDAQTIRAGFDETAGVVVSDLASRVDRIYAVTTAAEAPALSAALESAGGADPMPEFVPEVADAAGLTGSYLLVS